MTSAHFIYIPMVLLVGMVIGFVLGGRAARDAMELARRQEEKRAAARAEREARRRGALGAVGSGTAGSRDMDVAGVGSDGAGATDPAETGSGTGAAGAGPGAGGVSRTG